MIPSTPSQFITIISRAFSEFNEKKPYKGLSNW